MSDDLQPAIQNALARLPTPEQLKEQSGHEGDGKFKKGNKVRSLAKRIPSKKGRRRHQLKKSLDKAATPIAIGMIAAKWVKYLLESDPHENPHWVQDADKLFNRVLGKPGVEGEITKVQTEDLQRKFARLLSDLGGEIPPIIDGKIIESRTLEDAGGRESGSGEGDAALPDEVSGGPQPLHHGGEEPADRTDVCVRPEERPEADTGESED